MASEASFTFTFTSASEPPLAAASTTHWPGRLVQQLQRERLQRLGRRRYLRQHIDAVCVRLDHPLQPANLSLDAAQPREVVRLLAAVLVHHEHLPRHETLPLPPWGINTARVWRAPYPDGVSSR